MNKRIVVSAGNRTTNTYVYCVDKMQDILSSKELVHIVTTKGLKYKSWGK
jgi:hypothetical protein